MRSINEIVNEKPWLGWILFGSTLVVIFLVGLFAASIVERRSEAFMATAPPGAIGKMESRSEKWGRYFPREYQSWKNTSKMDIKTKYGGNQQVDALEEDPRLVVLWAGYGFSKDYNQPRGHFYAVDDVRKTLRTGAPKDGKGDTMPNTCWACKSPDVPRVMNDIGSAEFYKGKWSSRGDEIVHPIGCLDCHDPKTMDLRVSRPALIEAFERQGIDVTKMSHQEKRSLMCAQCHVEYYFKGEEKYLTFPWDDGMTVEGMEAYYDKREFNDWVHQLSRAPMLKAQHPGYEVYKTGIHAQRGISCVDCHMPYVSEGGVKYTDHQVISPLANISRTCQVCHRESEEDLLNNVYERQDKIMELRISAEETLVKAHVEAKKAWDLGATEVEMKPVLTLVRHAQWRWDFSVASHGASFHSPIEIARILSTSIQKGQEARLQLSRILAKHGFAGQVAMPDISTKAKAQRYIGLDMNKLNAEKKEFLKTVVPEWEKQAQDREAKLD